MVVVSHVIPVPSVAWRRPPRGVAVAPRLGVVGVLLAAAACAFAGLSSIFGDRPAVFVTPSRPAPRAAKSIVSRHAEEGTEETPGSAETAIEAPPSDEELEAMGNKRPQAHRYTPKKFIRGKMDYTRRELKEEAFRLKPYFDECMENHMVSLQELTFALNQQAPKLRHLLFRPRSGLPAFTAHHVRYLFTRIKKKRTHGVARRKRYVNGPRIYLGLSHWLRPHWLPPNAPGAPYPEQLGEYYAEVPPLKPWSPPEGQTKKKGKTKNSKEEKKLIEEPQEGEEAQEEKEEAGDADAGEAKD